MKKLINFLSKTTIAMGIGAAVVAGSVVYAAANIPVACSTPGDCAELDATFLNLTTQTVVQFLDSDASHFVSLIAPDTVLTNLAFTLPAVDGTAGQELRTDGSGNLSFTQVSKRVGEFVHAESGRSATDGYLAVTPGTISNGATDYPVWAAKHPEFVSGSDIVFPTTVNGIFLRNLGGNAGSEGTFQDDATARNGLTTASGGSHSHSFPGGSAVLFNATGGDLIDHDEGGGAGPNGSESNRIASGVNSAGSHAHTINGDTETRPANYAYQLYTIVDSY